MGKDQRLSVPGVSELLRGSRSMTVRQLFLVVGAGLVFLMVSLIMSGTSVRLAPDAYLLTHTILEIFAIVLALMVFSLMWSSRQFHSYQDVFIGSSLIAIVILDTLHVFSFPGMSNFYAKDSTRTTLFFWLMARYCSAITLIIASYLSTSTAKKIGSIYVLTAIFVLIGFISAYIAFRFPDQLPEFYIQDQGLTPLKISLEFILVILFTFAGIRFYRQNKESQEYVSFASACFFMAMSEFFFTQYFSLNDFYNLVGHVYKIIAYILLYNGIYESVVIEPYERSARTQRTLQQFFDSIPDLLWVKDTGGRYLMCNSAYETYLGYKEEDIIGKTDFDLAENTTAENMQAHDQSVVEHGDARLFDVPLKLKNEETRLFETKKVPVIDDNNRTVALLGIARDLTERVEAQEQLRKNDELLKKLSEQIPGFIYQFKLRPDGSSCFPYASEGIKQMYEVKPEEVTESSEKVLAYLHPDDYDHVMNKIQESAENLSEWHDTFRVKLPRQGVLWREGRSLPEKQEDGSILWHGYITDATKRKQAEERLTLAASVFEYALEGIIITDQQWNIIEVNNTFSDITNIDDRQILNTSFWDIPFRNDSELFMEVEAAINAQGHWKNELYLQLERPRQELILDASIVGVDDDKGLRSHYFIAMTDITIIKHSEKQLEFLAHHDPLTGLSNRFVLEKQLEQSISMASRKKTQVAVCFIDLDSFKPVNDDYGHQAGDTLLKELAVRFERELRQHDMISRPGGDEFVLVISDVADLHECQLAINRLIGITREPVVLEDGQKISTTCSIGVAIYPQDAMDASTLLRYADMAMYTAKQQGGNRMHLFDIESDTTLRKQKEVFENIEQALGNDELELYYQPRINMRTGKVLGAEGLIRWRHPEQGIIGPVEFMPAIEGSDLGRRVSNWVLETGIEQLHQWNNSGLDLQLSLNIDSHHLHSKGFIEHLEGVLRQYPDMNPGQICLEIVESTAITSFKSIADIIRECQEKIGVIFALDDFGTGYSSLTYLRKLPVNVVKIDQSFIRDMLEDPDDLAIIISVINLGNLFGLKVIAEGVESFEHAGMLLQMGCEDAQGYGFARPMPATELPGWLADYKHPPHLAEQEYIQITPEEIQLKKVERDHAKWADAILRYLKGIAEQPPIIVDETMCRFESWISGRGSFQYGETSLFNALIIVHNDFHKAVQKAVSNKRKGLLDDIEQDIARIETMKHKLANTIEDIRKSH